MRKIYFCFLIMTSVLITASCEDHYGICNVSRAVYLQGSFYRINGATETPILAPSLTMSYLNTSSFIYENSANQHEFKVLLSPVEDTLNYYIRLEPSALPDTISVVYSTQPYAISEECGTISIYTLVNAYSTRNTIDSVAITSNAVTNTSGQNLKIYF